MLLPARALNRIILPYQSDPKLMITSCFATSDAAATQLSYYYIDDSMRE